MAQREVLARIPGTSTTGIAHDILIERAADGDVMVTIMGADGKKRHATALIMPGTLTDLVRNWNRDNTDRSL